MRRPVQALDDLICKLRDIERDVLTGVASQLADEDLEYGRKLAQLKQVTDDLRTSLWCAFVAKNSPEKVKEFVERHRLNRVFTLLRNCYPMDPELQQASKPARAHFTAHS